MHLRDRKKELRLAIQERLEHMSDERHAAESRSVCRRLLEIIPKGSTVLAYWALKTEPDLRLLIDELLERGDTVFLPCFKDHETECRQIEPGMTLKKGPIKIIEPPVDAPVLDLADLDIALVPGRAFEANGKRLGRGNGGFDIWIKKLREKNPKTQVVGVAFDCQIFTEIPMEEHDEVVDQVITARGEKG